MGHLWEEADLVAPIWTAYVGRLKMLFLSPLLGGTFGPSVRQGVVEPSLPFSRSEKLSVDTNRRLCRACSWRRAFYKGMW